VSDVVVLGAKRTPFGRFGGAMKALPIPLLGAHAARAALDDAGVSADMIDEVALGVNLPGSDRSIARQLALHAGVPDDRTAYTVDRACCSSLTAFSLGARAIQVGDARLALVGGAENMSRVPYFLEDMRWGHRLGGIEIKDQLVISCPCTGVPRAVQAADEALRYDVDRAQQDAWALRSQRRAADAAAAGRFDDQIAPIELQDGRGGVTAVDADENLRGDVTLERLAALPTVYGSATVTAGNAPGLSTGASQLVIADAEAAASLGTRPLATLLATARVSGPPANIASIPATAVRRVLERAGVALDDVDLIEINEAFAAVPLVSTQILAGGDIARADALRERVNVNGGAIAIGHPTGATAGRLIMNVIYELRRRGGGLGLVALCGGIGEAEAALLQVSAEGEPV
jgi:acetyl-CoA C-acetyltransferase